MNVKNAGFSVARGNLSKTWGGPRILPHYLSEFIFVTLFGFFAFCFPATGYCQEKTDVALPEVVTKHIAGAGRFDDSEYARLMRGDGINQVAPKIIFDRMKAAADAKENYKALYFARIFTTVQPDSAAGWKNRAILAASLGLHEEAAAAELRASDTTNKIQVQSFVLPGRGLTVKPATLSDWAGAILLLADGTASVRQENFLLAARDEVSGVSVSTSDEVREQDQQLTQMGLPPEGPWSDPKPINNIAPKNCPVFIDLKCIASAFSSTKQFVRT
jgi:hypothetical protein